MKLQFDVMPSRSSCYLPHFIAAKLLTFCFKFTSSMRGYWFNATPETEGDVSVE